MLWFDPIENWNLLNYEQFTGQSCPTNRIKHMCETQGSNWSIHPPQKTCLFPASPKSHYLKDVLKATQRSEPWRDPHLTASGWILMVPMSPSFGGSQGIKCWENHGTPDGLKMILSCFLCWLVSLASFDGHVVVNRSFRLQHLNPVGVEDLLTSCQENHFLISEFVYKWIIPL